MSEERSRARWIEEAVARFERPLLRSAIRLTGDLDTARDVVQETLLELCKADRAQVEGHLAAWLYTVCRNRALDVLRKEGRVGAIADSSRLADHRKDSGGPCADAAAREAREIVLRVMETLPAQEREAFILKFQDELTYREICQVMGKSLGTVSKLITSALGAVRDALGGGPQPSKES